MPGTTSDTIAAALAAAGLDLLQPFQVGWYNDACPTHPLPDLGDRHHLGLLIGNSRALWPHFLAARAADPALAREPHPLDRYVSAAVRAALAPLAEPWEVRFAPEPPPRRVAMQRLAEVSGLAALAPSHLSVHPTFGPWIALRAAAVIARPGPAARTPAPALACDCEHGCLPPLRAALAAGAPSSQADVRERWRLWLAVRDGCPLGRAHRYGDDQIRYHYTGVRSL
ncbi:MAG TPA: hypothetical protein VL172_19955 [Kofleriaceae bacterium]|nr:hypothetical protein [Kofleriaceae bacterium]